MTQLSRPGWIVFLALVLSGSPALAAQPAGGELDVFLVEQADTPQEHAALAAHFRDKAERQRGMAEHHRRMMEGYRHEKLALTRKQREHCRKLIRLNEELAAEYEAMAENHAAEAEGAASE